MAQKKAKQEDTKGVEEKPAHTLSSMMTSQNAAYGERTVLVGNAMRRDPPRLPTGIFTVDYVTGGGLPVSGSSCLWGPDAGGKTNMVLSATAVAQQICWRCFLPIKFCTCKGAALLMNAFWGDAEGTLDAAWAASIGVDMNRVYVGSGDYGEAYINMAEQAIQAEDCGLVALDSLAALIPESELNAPMENKFIANQALMITRGVRKLKQRIVQERKKGHMVVLLFTNQMRYKIGEMFGSPETMPGGWALRHEFSLLLRCAKKALDKQSSDSKFIDNTRKKNTAQRFSFSVKKTKVLTLAGIGEYVRMTEPMPELNLRKGQISDHTAVYSHARELSLIQKVSKGYQVGEKVFKKVEDIKDYWKQDNAAYLLMQRAIIEKAKDRLYNA